MDEAEFIEKKPFLFHLTPTSNLASIRRSRCLYSAKQLIALAGLEYVRGAPRVAARELVLPDRTRVVLRDQLPLLVPGQMTLEPGFTLDALVELIDSHVLFWTGDDEGLSISAKYAQVEQAWLRVPSRDLFAANHDPRFCRYNSGGPRASGGVPSPRGRRLFCSSGSYKDNISSVREVAFYGQAVLPGSTQVRLLEARAFVPL